MSRLLGYSRDIVAGLLWRRCGDFSCRDESPRRKTEAEFLTLPNDPPPLPTWRSGAMLIIYLMWHITEIFIRSSICTSRRSRSFCTPDAVRLPKPCISVISFHLYSQSKLIFKKNSNHLLSDLFQPNVYLLRTRHLVVCNNLNSTHFQMAAGHVRRAADRSDDWRRKVLLERPQPRWGPPTCYSECEGHHRRRLRHWKDVHICWHRLHRVCYLH